MENSEYYSGVEDEYVLLSRAAEETGYSAEWLRKQIIEGKLPGRKEHGRYWVTTMSTVRELKQRPKSKGGRPPKTTD